MYFNQQLGFEPNAMLSPFYLSQDPSAEFSDFLLNFKTMRNPSNPDKFVIQDMQPGSFEFNLVEKAFMGTSGSAHNTQKLKDEPKTF